VLVLVLVGARTSCPPVADFEYEYEHEYEKSADALMMHMPPAHPDTIRSRRKKGDGKTYTKKYYGRPEPS